MDYLKIEEVSANWKISPRRLQTLCAQGKIKGAVRFGRAWMIPKDAQKPVDGRTKAGKKPENTAIAHDMPMPRKTPFIHMTDLYSSVGDISSSIDALSDNPEAQTLFSTWISYSKGKIDDVYENANYLLSKHSGLYAVLSAGMLLALCAIWRGDLIMWRQAKKHITEAPARTEFDRELMSLSITAVDSMLYDISAFPIWFKMGRFEVLHKDTLPAVKVFYAKYLYAASYAVATKQFEMQGFQGLTLMSVVPSVLEPMIAQAVAESSIVAEIYLRMTCAVVYHNSSNDAEAIYHIDRAVEKALPDKLYGLLAEYGRTLYSLLEQRMNLIAPEAWQEVNKLYNVYNDGWSRLSRSVLGKKIASSLTLKEREVAKLAAFGMKNGEIATTLHMSVSAVKQAITSIFNKTGVSRDEFYAIL